ncbi:MAG: DUF433 domain-containing protein [Gammaproteobacteria bacterium]|nr:DUF433 domain-containing protein [Gammaproteobacteria bacterium]
MTDWRTCPAVERDPERMSGALVFRGTRMPVATVFENLKAGATVGEILEWYPGMTGAEVEAVLDHLIRSMQAPVVRQMERRSPRSGRGRGRGVDGWIIWPRRRSGISAVATGVLADQATELRGGLLRTDEHVPGRQPTGRGRPSHRRQGCMMWSRWC